MIKTFECPACGHGLKLQVDSVQGGIIRWRREVLTADDVAALVDRVKEIVPKTPMRIETKTVYPVGGDMAGHEKVTPIKEAKDVGCKWDCETCRCARG
jgi:hypothetical protein